MPGKIDPELYELAFSYRDYEEEVNFIELVWQQHTGTENSRVLDIASGIGEHLRQFCLRGYPCDGFDLDPDMVDYASAKFAAENCPIKVWTADMREFEVEEQYGLAINMLTSANLLSTNEELISHLRSAARALAPGGIYFLEMFHPREYGFDADFPPHVWEVQQDDFSLECDLRHKLEPLDAISQCQISTMRIAVTRENVTQEFSLTRTQRVYLYNEFQTLVEIAGGFEPVACFGAFNTECELDGSRRSWRMIPVLRKVEEGNS